MQWLYVMRTTPNISHLFKALEYVIQEEFMPGRSDGLEGNEAPMPLLECPTTSR